MPEFLQRRFVNDRGNLYFHHRDFPTIAVRETTPKNLFVEKDLYTRVDGDGSKDTAIEVAFNELETIADRLIERFVSAVRAGKAPELDATEKSAWDDFVFLQTKRVPEFHNQYKIEFGFEEELERIIARYEREIRPLTPEEKAEFKDPENIERIKRNTKLTALTQPGTLVKQALAEKGLAIAHITSPNRSFVLGSSPVAKLNFPDRPHLSDPSVEVWLPISWDVAVSPSPSEGIVQRLEISDPKNIRGINLAIASQSKIVAGRDEALVRSIVRPR